MPKKPTGPITLFIKKAPARTYKEHCAKWGNGCGSTECSKPRTRIVFARGQLPCDVLLIGQAPGESENILGYPFAGPAGHLLDTIVLDALGDIVLGKTGDADNRRPRVAFYNVVGCIPRDGMGDETKPGAEQIDACRPRLEEFIGIARPRLVVFVGDVSKQIFDKKYKGFLPLPDGTREVSIVHPGFIIRKSRAEQGLLKMKAVAALSSAAEDVFS